MISVTRRYTLPASHRLASDSLSDEENREIFGKCNNPGGHGHNYGIEVTVRGPVDPQCGQIIPRERLDALFDQVIREPMSHRFLNDVEMFEGRVTTAEVIAEVVHRELGLALATAGEARLARVRIVETGNNVCEYGEPT